MALYGLVWPSLSNPGLAWPWLVPSPITYTLSAVTFSKGQRLKETCNRFFSLKKNLNFTFEKKIASRTDRFF
jgi:hypothetical protein